MRYVVVITLLLCTINIKAQTNPDIAAIKVAMDKQATDWNNGNLDGFMDTYLHSDSLMFIGSKGITWGWDSTLARYKRNYPTQRERGVLKFDLLVIKRLSDEYYFVVGKFNLTRDAGNASGHFDLLFKKIRNKWLIISDHSS